MKATKSINARVRRAVEQIWVLTWFASEGICCTVCVLVNFYFTTRTSEKRTVVYVYKRIKKQLRISATTQQEMWCIYKNAIAPSCAKSGTFLSILHAVKKDSEQKLSFLVHTRAHKHTTIQSACTLDTPVTERATLLHSYCTSHIHNTTIQNAECMGKILLLTLLQQLSHSRQDK